MPGWTTTSIAPRFLATVLEQSDQPLDDWLAGVGVGREALVDADMAWPLEAFRELWARAAAVQPDIGLTLVDRFPAGQMHLLAHLAMRSSSVGAAIADICRFATVNSAADQLQLESHDGLACLSYRRLDEGPPNPWMAEHYFSMASVFLAQATGRALPLHSVDFAEPAQAPDLAYISRFGLLPRFGAGNSVLRFEVQALSWPLATHDPYLHGILTRVAQTRQPEPTDDLLTTARRAMTRRLLMAEPATLDALASELARTPRALGSQLGKSGCTFRQLVDGVRRDLVREHLDRGLSVTETTHLLGFSEPAALQHACKRWFGRAAGEVRRSRA